MEDRYKSELEQCSINSIYSDLINEDTKIDLNPEYQREVIWDEEKMRYFIDSLNTGIIPTNLVFNINSDTGSKTCIDGKQRISSIKRFMENDRSIYLTDIDDKKIYFNKIPEGEINARTFLQKERTEFVNKKIPVVTYRDLNYSDQLNIFKRIQEGKTLTPGELIISQFSDVNIAKRFKFLCDKNKDTIKGLVKLDRQNHYFFLTELMLLLNDGLNSLNKNKREKFIKNIKTVNDLNRKYEPVDNILNKLFNDDILYNEKIKAKSRIKNNSLLVIIYSVNNKFKTNLNKINKKHNIIVDVICKIIDKKMDGGKDENTMKSIFNTFNKIYNDLDKKDETNSEEIIEEKEIKNADINSKSKYKILVKGTNNNNPNKNNLKVIRKK